MIDDFESCYRAVSSKDPRFDGWFIVAVTSTGIYCRPSCPARTPRPGNVRFYPTSAAAQAAGFRSCKRCRPDATPGSPEWDSRADVVARAMRLIADGAIDRHGVAGLAAEVGYSTRQLQRVMVDELGAGPLSMARAQRAQTARVLIETTDLPFSDVAFAAGFGSIRQFNDTIRAVFDRTPGAMRDRRGRTTGTGSGVACDTARGAITLRLPFRAPLAAHPLFEFLAHRAVPGVEETERSTASWPPIDPSEPATDRADQPARGPAERHRDRSRSGNGTDRDHHRPLTYRRTLDLPHTPATVSLTPEADHIRCTLKLGDLRDLATAVHRCRRLCDLDADPVAVDHVLGADPLLAPLVAARPGLRTPGATSGDELATRAVLGQQVSVVAARTVAGRLTTALGRPLPEPDGGLTHVFPTASAIADAPDHLLAMPAARRRALRGLAAALADGKLSLDPGADRHETRTRLLALDGIGPWTADYLSLRALGDPDVLLETDLGVRHALAALGGPDSPRAIRSRAERWRPWRSYATLHLWSSLP